MELETDPLNIIFARLEILFNSHVVLDITNVIVTEQVFTFLETRGWVQFPHGNPHVRVYRHLEYNWDDGDPIDMVCPASDRYQDTKLRIRHVTNLLATLYGTAQPRIVEQILGLPDGYTRSGAFTDRSWLSDIRQLAYKLGVGSPIENQEGGRRDTILEEVISRLLAGSTIEEADNALYTREELLQFLGYYGVYPCPACGKWYQGMWLKEEAIPPCPTCERGTMSSQEKDWFQLPDTCSKCGRSLTWGMCLDCESLVDEEEGGHADGGR